METIGKIFDFLISNSEIVLQVLGALGLLKWFQGDAKKRAASIARVADELFDLVEVSAKELGWSSAEKWAKFFDMLVARLAASGVKIRTAEIRRVEKMVQEKAKVLPHLHVTPTSGI